MSRIVLTPRAAAVDHREQHPGDGRAECCKEVAFGNAPALAARDDPALMILLRDVRRVNDRVR
jgi:hypothetical protein